MVRKEDLPETTEATTIIATYVHDALQSKQITYDDIAKRLKRARSYVGLRVSGLKPWNLDELDILADMFGLDSAFQLVNNARVFSQAAKRKAQQHIYFSDLTFAANEDPNKRIEREYDDFGA